MSTDIMRTSNQTVGETIDRLMAEQGRKAFWVAAQVGVSMGTFRAIRTGRRALLLDEAVRLAALFDVPLDVFVPQLEEVSS